MFWEKGDLVGFGGPPLARRHRLAEEPLSLPQVASWGKKGDPRWGAAGEGGQPSPNRFPWKWRRSVVGGYFPERVSGGRGDLEGPIRQVLAVPPGSPPELPGSPLRS
jgi:hypothetical protein